MARLQQALDGLDDAKRRLWRELASGKKLRQIAAEQGVSYDRVKRQRRRLLAQLAAQLRNAWGDGPPGSTTDFSDIFCPFFERQS
jgi:DNA-binding CsgD family transcriptional regulator